MSAAGDAKPGLVGRLRERGRERRERRERRKGEFDDSSARSADGRMHQGPMFRK